MKCSEFQSALSDWLYTIWDTENPCNAEVPDGLAGHATVCDRCRDRLEQAIDLVDAGERDVDAPPFLASRINGALAAEKSGTGYYGHRRVLRFAVAATAAAAVLAVALVLTLVFPRHNDSVTVTFRLEAPEAEQVNVVGDWNGWAPEADPLSDRDGDGTWEATIELKAGKEYRYQFYINGEDWIADPEAALIIDDGFGGTNSILSI